MSGGPATSSAAPEHLERLQRWVQHAITHPGGIDAGAATPEARAALDAGVEDVVLPSAGLRASERLAVYGRMYFARLVEVLEDEFPATRSALGEAAFEALARDCVVRHPSTRYTLNALGAPLPAFLRDEAVALDGPERAFLAELATLERAVQEVFDAPRVEPVGVDDLLALTEEEWVGARLELVPALRLFAFEHPTNDWYQAFRDDAPRPPSERRETWLALYRREDRVWRLALSRAQHAILDALAHGARLGEALERAATLPDADVGELTEGIRTWFQDWTGLGFFRSVRRA